MCVFHPSFAIESFLILGILLGLFSLSSVIMYYLLMKQMDEMVGQHHQFNGHEPGQTLRLKDREAWHAAVHGVAESDTTERLNHNSEAN